jgi:hypothetical protein
MAICTSLLPILRATRSRHTTVAVERTRQAGRRRPQPHGSTLVNHTATPVNLDGAAPHDGEGTVIAVDGNDFLAWQSGFNV